MSQSGPVKKCQKATATVFCTPATVHNNIFGRFVPSQSPHPAAAVDYQAGGQQIRSNPIAGTGVPPPQAQTIEVSEEVIPKVYIRAVSNCKSKGKEDKTIVLRDIVVESVSSIPELKNVIKKQLKNDIIEDDFDVGVMQGTTVVNIRTVENLKEFWLDLKKGVKVLLWCDALKDETTNVVAIAPLNIQIPMMTLKLKVKRSV